jgi:hypothetical protein
MVLHLSDHLRPALAFGTTRNDLPEDPAVVDYYEQRMIDTYAEEIEALRREWGLQE